MLDQTPTRNSTASAAVTDSPLAAVDPELSAILDGELARQRGTLEMIASENFAPRAVLEAGNVVEDDEDPVVVPGEN